jgi:hypothetical protein
MEMKKVEIKQSVSFFENLLYHNQFVLGPHFLENLTSWKKIRVNESIYLTVHPDLNTCQAVRGDKSITLIGYILDPDNPEAGNSDIITLMIQELFSCETFFENTYKYGGRWILIVDDGREIRLLNDAAGLRQVFYTDIRCTKDLWCASQPGILAEILNLRMSDDAIDFINSYEFRMHKEYRWPGYSSSYREISHMLPNHYLNLQTGICQRYWPDRPLDAMLPHEAMQNIAATLKGLMKCALNRYELALSITAGLDSRLLLAVSKEISNLVSYMTVRQIGIPENHPDVAIPSLLLSQLGLKHDIVKSSLLMDDEFITVFKKNVQMSHDVYAPDAQAILNFYSQEKVAVTGSVCEIGRCSFRSSLKKSNKEEVTAADLAKLQWMGSNPFAVRHFHEWLEKLGEIYNVHILDLFEWEQGHGNWLAMCQLEFDSAWKDIFTPFNCRRLLITMLSVDEKFRKPPKSLLYKNLIETMWPEVLGIPINPHKKKTIYSFIKSRIPEVIKKGLRKY